jgi:hypothetical protein
MPNITPRISASEYLALVAKTPSRQASAWAKGRANRAKANSSGQSQSIDPSIEAPKKLAPNKLADRVDCALAGSPSKPKRRNDEEMLQRAAFAWVQAHEPRHPILARMFHPASGGARSRGEAGKLKAMGVRRGPPDFLLPLPSPSTAFTGLALELKSTTGRPTPEQIEWMADFERAGYVCGFVRTLDEFIDRVQAYLGSTCKIDS